MKYLSNIRYVPLNTHHKNLPPPLLINQPMPTARIRERQFEGQEGVQAFVVLVQPAAKETTVASIGPFYLKLESLSNLSEFKITSYISHIYI